MKTMLDWTLPQHCQDCGRRLRPAKAPAADWPGTRPHNGRGLCKPCRQACRRAGYRSGYCTRRDAERRGGNPTVAELAAAGHPCIEPAPMPSRERTYPL